MSPRPTRSIDSRIGARDAGLRRLRRVTALGLAAAGALSVAFGDLAAHAFHGRSRATSTVAKTSTVTKRTTATSTRAVATPPPLVSAGSAAQAAAAAAQAPVQSQAPPVVVSGGT